MDQRLVSPEVVLIVDGRKEKDHKACNDPKRDLRDLFSEPDDPRKNEPVEHKVHKLVNYEVPAGEPVQQPNEKFGGERPVFVLLFEKPLKREAFRQVAGI